MRHPCGRLWPRSGEGFAVSGKGERIEGEEDQKIIRAQSGDNRPFLEFEADGNRLFLEPCAQRSDPCVDGFWLVFEDGALSFCGARSLEANIMFGISPVKTDKGGTFLRRFLRHV